MQFERIGRGPALILIPGLACDGRMWEAVARPLASRFTTILPEIWPCCSVVDAAQGIAEIIDGLGVPPAGVAGLSMGGYVTFELLRTWPHKVRAAAILDSTPFPDPPDRMKSRQAVLDLLEHGEFDKVLTGFLGSVLAPRNAASGPARDLLTAMARDLGPAVYARSLGAIIARRSYEDVLPLVRVPMLLLSGEHDALTPPELARQVASMVPGARAVEVADAGHMTPLEAPERVGELLGSFFEGVFSTPLPV